ncbi:hypothetical protein ACHWQZ_G008782 [Mnemiopsis leidyi]
MLLAYFQKVLDMILTTTLLVITVLLILLLVDKCAEGAAVDVTLMKYHNDTTICSLGLSAFQCDFQFTLSFEGVSSGKEYLKIKTDSFTADAGKNVNFRTGNDALKSGVFNPIAINLNHVEDIRLKVKVVDDDYLSDDLISEFKMYVDVKQKTSHANHRLDYNTREGSGLFRISYKVYCDGNQSGVGCTGCKQDYYSTNCTKFCQPYNNFTCNNSGDHICKPNYYNTSCNIFCVPTSQYTCSNNGSKECLGRWTGENCDILTPCPTGRYGENCSVNCTEIPGQYTCNSTTGEKVCESHWTGSQCDICKSNYFGANCTTFCEPSFAWNCSDTGERECLEHFTGKNCSDCQAGWYGIGCDIFCDHNSKLWTCDKNGNKICNGNRNGVNCSDCMKGWYNKNCSVNCTEVPGQYTCNSTTGEKVCGSYWTGSQCDICKSNYFGANCTTFCDKNSTLWTCDQNGDKICNGNKQGEDCRECEDGWYGVECTVECVETFQYSCSDQGTKTCSANWIGTNCDRCNDGYFGANCTTWCKSDPGRGECDRQGVLHCFPGFSGPNCSIHTEKNSEPLPQLSKSLLVFCILSGVLFSLASAIALYGMFKGGKKVVRRRLSSLKIKPEQSTQPVAFRNHYFIESSSSSPTPSQESAIRIEFIEDM